MLSFKEKVRYLKAKLASLPPPSGEEYRMSGEGLCPICGLEANTHPLDDKLISYSGLPFMRVLCNGDRVKL